MAKATESGGVHLPEPRHPFARWCAGASVGVWALGVQSFHDPWSKFGAVLSPGVGYVVGLILDSAVSSASDRNSKKAHEQFLLENKIRIDLLYKEREDSIQLGANSEVIQVIDLAIVANQKERYKVMSPEGDVAPKKTRPDVQSGSVQKS